MPYMFQVYLCYAVLSVLCNLWSPAVKLLTSYVSSLLYLVVFCHFPLVCPGSDVVLNCIEF